MFQDQPTEFYLTLIVKIYEINYITVAIIVIKHFHPTFSIHAPKDIKRT